MGRRIFAVAAFGLPLAIACSGASSVDFFDPSAADGGTNAPPPPPPPVVPPNPPPNPPPPPPPPPADASTDAPKDVATDSCAVDCKGNPCAGTTCLPLTLTSAAPGAYYVAVDGTDVFWGETGHAGTILDPDRLAKTKKAGGFAVVPLDVQSGAMTGFVLDATTVSWLRTGKTSCEVRSAAKDGTGAKTPGFVMGGGCEYVGIAVDAMLLYVGWGQRVRTFDRGGSFSGGTALSPSLQHVADVVLAGGLLYVADDKASTILVVDPTNGNVASESPTAAPARDLFVTATHIYFAAGTMVGRMPIAGGAVDVIATGLTGAEGIAVAGGNVYFTTTSTVERAAVGSAVHTSIATGLTKAGRIALDATYAYVADTGAGKILRLVP